MKKIAKYLKPFLGGVLLSFLLLFGQAMCDLSLPTYMSDIVNVGIQKGGIEHAAVEVLSVRGMEAMRIFMDDEGKALVDAWYTLTDASQKNATGKAYSEVYTNLPEDQLYVRNSFPKGEEKNLQVQLDAAFDGAGATLVAVMQSMAPQQEGMQESSVDIVRLYEALPRLRSLPSGTFDGARQAAAQMPDMIRDQTGVTLARGILAEMGADMAGIQSAYIWRVGLLMLLITLAGGVATVLVGLLSAQISAGVSRKLRTEVFARVESFSNKELDQFSTASLITRTTNDVTQVQMFVMMGIRMLCYAPIMCVGGIIMAVRRAASMAWIIALAGGVLIVLIGVVFVIAVPRFKLIQKLIDKLNLVSRESLSGLMVIRAFGTAEHEKDRFDKANLDLTKASLFVNRVMATMMPIIMLLMNCVSLLVIWNGAHQIANATVQIGDMMAFIQYAMQTIMSFLFLTMIFVFAPRAAVSAARIAQVLETEPSIVDPAQPKAFDPAKKGVVEFDHVNFRYDGAEENALSDITFTAQPGQTTAIIGSTGSGKSTIANLMLRFYDVSGGSIRVDGADVREVGQHDLRARIGYVPQKGVLLSGTIASNLRYGDESATDTQLETAAHIAQAMTFIDEKDDRFESEIAQGGANVSGGQKQRLSIARALVKKPEILVFDDSFSALDYKTDVALRRALKENTGESTVMIIAQRVGTIMHAEQIIVLDQGRIVGKGTHTELMRTCPEYQEIASSQLSKEELA